MSPAPYAPDARREITRLRKDLDDLFQRAQALDEADELAGDISRYLCVRVSGFLEQALASSARSLCSRSSWGPVQRFGLSWLKKSPNPRTDEILKFVRRFDEQWASDLERLLNENENGQSINSLLGIRNDIAHGRSQGVSRTRAFEYYAVADAVVEFVLERFEPIPKPGGASP